MVSGILGTILPLLIGALWGIGDGVLNTQLSALLGILFKHDLVLIFSVTFLDMILVIEQNILPPYLVK